MLTAGGPSPLQQVSPAKPSLENENHPWLPAQGQERWGQQLVEDMAIVYEKKKCFLKPTKNTHLGELGWGGSVPEQPTAGKGWE